MKRIVPYIRYIWHITEGFHRAAVLRTLLGVVRVAVVLIFIWLSKTAIDCATGRVAAPDGTLVLWFGLMVLCLPADIALSQWARYIESRATMRMNLRVNRRLFNVLMNLPPVNGRQGFHSGDMLNRLTLDVRSVASFALSQFPTMVILAVQLLASFVFLAWLSPLLALAPVVIMPFCLLAGRFYFRRHRRFTADIREGESEAHVSVQEGLKHRMVLKSLECIGELDRRLGLIHDRIDTANRKQTRLSAVGGAMTRLGFALGYLTAFGWSIFSLDAGLITFGTMTAFIQLVSRIQQPIAGISGYLPAFISTSVAIDRLRAIDLPTPIPNSQLSTPHSQFHTLNSQFSILNSQLPTGIRVRDLTFRYEADGRDILSSFSHDFRPGSRTMITGSTGAGKTTLIRLLLGLLEPDAGTIEIYDVSGATPVSASTLSHFAYVPQGNSLLPGTIRDNLLLADPDASDERLAEALHVAAADFVADLPLGLNTSCDEAGGGLSEGQAQRIAIARALLRPGTIMILDEFNSALDADTAATLMQRLAAHRPHSTIIIIAHHHSTIAPYCDTHLPF